MATGRVPTRSGTSESVSLPTPSCPVVFRPQHHTSWLISAQENPSPAVTISGEAALAGADWPSVATPVSAVVKTTAAAASRPDTDLRVRARRIPRMGLRPPLSLSPPAADRQLESNYSGAAPPERNTLELVPAVSHKKGVVIGSGH